MKTVNENIFVLPREAAWPLGNGFFPLPEGLLEGLEHHGRFMDRALAEQDPAFKQIIPYVMVEHGGQVLSYRRTSRSGEERLRHKCSIGFGGHINDTDQRPGTNILYTGLMREINEEIFLPTLTEIRLAGCINDDSNPVGRVHLGLLFRARLATPAFTINEPDKLVAQWSSLAELDALRADMETWSQLALGALHHDVC